MGGKKTTFFNERTGRYSRICCECRVEKDLEKNFAKARKVRTGNPSLDFAYQCSKCKVGYGMALVGKKLDDPVEAPKVRAQRAAWAKSWRERNPERDRETRKRQDRKRRKDPAVRTREAELARLDYHLRREREGKLTTRRFGDVLMANDEIPRVPVKPFLRTLRWAIDNREGGMMELSRDTQVPERTFRAWLSGERKEMQFDVADRVLTKLEIGWWEIWPEGEYPEIHDRLAA